MTNKNNRIQLVAVASIVGVAVLFLYATFLMDDFKATLSDNDYYTLYTYNDGAGKYLLTPNQKEKDKKILSDVLREGEFETQIYNTDTLGVPELKATRIPSASNTLKTYHKGAEIYFLEHLNEYIILTDKGAIVVNSWGQYKDVYSLLERSKTL